jgi:serine/threonine protein kinase
MAHKYIVKWYQVFEDDEFVYMILELCEGKVCAVVDGRRLWIC